MQERKVEKLRRSLSAAELDRRHEKLEAAIMRFEPNLLMDIRLYLRRFDLEHLSHRADGIWRETIVTAWRNAENYDPDCSAKSWLRAVAFNVIRHLRRNDERKIPLASVADAALHLGFDGDVEETSETDLFDYLEQRSVKRFFKQTTAWTADEILSLVGADDRAILRMRFVEDLSAREIAARFGISEGAADVRLSRAKNRLRKEYLKR